MPVGVLMIGKKKNLWLKLVRGEVLFLKCDAEGVVQEDFPAGPGRIVARAY